MADRIFRLEKTVEGKLYYMELAKEAKNSTVRFWNVFGPTGLSVAKSEKESFQTAADLEAYSKNARKQYEAQGFKEREAVKQNEPVVLE